MLMQATYLMLSRAETLNLVRGNRGFWIMRSLNAIAALSAVQLTTSPFWEIRLVAAVLVSVAGSISVSVFFTSPIVTAIEFAFKYRKSHEIFEEDYSWLVKLAGVKVKKKLKIINGLNNAFSNRNNKSVSYGYTLYSRQDRSDRQFVMAHELGHQVSWGITPKTWILTGASIVFIAILAYATSSTAIVWVAAISLFSTVMVLIRWDGEFFADQFACKILGPRAAIRALSRLGPSSRLSVISDSHPSIARRIRRVEKNWSLPQSYKL
jgi:Zn-dependent protease with chaperone function